MPRWKKAQVVKIEDYSNRLRLVEIEVEEEDIQYEPGQFIIMDLPVGEKRQERWRSYSIANIMNKKNILELCLAKVPKGKATTYLFKKIEIGTEIQFKGPQGSFVLPDIISKDIIMICTGTGIAPFRAMINHIFCNNIKHKKIQLIFGSRKRKDMLYHEEFEKLAADHPEFSYHVALSREDYSGYRGYVHGIYEKMKTEELQNSRFYLCGWQNMIDEAILRLTQNHKIDRSMIQYELYG